jgi:hypothetical protein
MFAAFADVQFVSTPLGSDVIAAATSSKAKLTLGGGGGGDGQATLRPVLEYEILEVMVAGREPHILRASKQTMTADAELFSLGTTAVLYCDGLPATCTTVLGPGQPNASPLRHEVSRSSAAS